MGSGRARVSRSNPAGSTLGPAVIAVPLFGCRTARRMPGNRARVCDPAALTEPLHHSGRRKSPGGMVDRTDFRGRLTGAPGMTTRWGEHVVQVGASGESGWGEREVRRAVAHPPSERFNFADELWVHLAGNLADHVSRTV